MPVDLSQPADPCPKALYHLGDTSKVTASLPAESVDLIFTSPPFLGLRSYLPDDSPLKDLEMGSEPSPAAFIEALLAATAEWRRVLAPHGTLAVELGDSYAGSGGAGGDYRKGKLREGQQTFTGSAKAAREASGWPLPKSLCLIPELYRVALVYGINPLTGDESPAGQWRARNVVRWHRTNPPVGALADKFRPATSDIIVACVSPKRYFDLEAVRVPASEKTHARTAKGVEVRPSSGKKVDDERTGGNRSTLAEMQHTPNGAPPLDTWIIPTQGYKGSHYAVFPPKLVERPVEAMSPRRVCTSCGAPSTRITAPVEEVAEANRQIRVESVRKGNPNRRDNGAQGFLPSESTTLGWTHCGCGEACRPTTWQKVVTETCQVRVDGQWEDFIGPPAPGAETRTKKRSKRVIDDLGECNDPSHWRNGIVFDPFAGSGTTLMVASQKGRHAVGIDLDERNVELARDRVGSDVFYLAGA